MPGGLDFPAVSRFCPQLDYFTRATWAGRGCLADDHWPQPHTHYWNLGWLNGACMPCRSVSAWWDVMKDWCWLVGAIWWWWCFWLIEGLGLVCALVSMGFWLMTERCNSGICETIWNAWQSSNLTCVLKMRILYIRNSESFAKKFVVTDDICLQFLILSTVPTSHHLACLSITSLPGLWS